MICPKCGTEYNNDVKFCTKCGEQLSSQKAENSETPYVINRAPVQNEPVKAPSSGLSVAALVCGLLGIIGSFIPIVKYFTLVLAILGIVFGVIGKKKAAESGNTNTGLATAGLVLGIIGTAFSAVGVICALACVGAASAAADSSVAKEILGSAADSVKESVTSAVNEAFSSASESISAAAESARETVTSAADALADKIVSSAADKANEIASSAADKAAQAAADAADSFVNSLFSSN